MTFTPEQWEQLVKFFEHPAVRYLPLWLYLLGSTFLGLLAASLYLAFTTHSLESKIKQLKDEVEQMRGQPYQEFNQEPHIPNNYQYQPRPTVPEREKYQW